MAKATKNAKKLENAIDATTFLRLGGFVVIVRRGCGAFREPKIIICVLDK